jgi:hypothetical protein
MNIEDLTQSVIDEEGTFRAIPIDWTLEESDTVDEETGKKSQSVALAIKLSIVSKWHPDADGGAWSQDYPPGWYVEHRGWVVKKDGTLNEKALASLSECGLFDGEFEKVLEGPPPQVTVLAEVSKENYKGQDRMRANWVNPNADRPQPRGQFRPANPDLVNSLRARFGSQAKAIAGGKPGGKPPAPPKAAAGKPAAPKAPAPTVKAPPTVRGPQQAVQASQEVDPEDPVDTGDDDEVPFG